MQAFYIGFAAVALYGAFIGIKSLVKMWQMGETGKKMFLRYLIFFVVAPCIFTAGYYIIDEKEPNLWLVAPLVLLAFMWLISGFFAQSAYQRLSSGQKPNKTNAKAKNTILLGLSMLLVGFIIWLVGFFNGYPNGESFLLVLSIFLIIRGGYMGFSNLKHLKAKPQKIKHSKQNKHKSKK